MWACRSHAIHMLVKRWMDGVPKWIEYKINTFTARELGCRDKVRIPCDEHNLIHLALEAQRCDINADSHIDAFLDRGVVEIVVAQRREL